MGIMLGVRYLLEGSLPKAILEFKRSVDVDPNSITAHYLLAVGQLQAGHFADAERELHVALNIDPEYYRARVQLVLCYISQERYGAALELFLTLGTEASIPQESFIREMFGNITRRLQNRLPRTQNPYEVYNSLGIVYSLMGNASKAREYWHKSLTVYPDQPVVARLLDPSSASTKASKRNAGKNEERTRSSAP